MNVSFDRGFFYIQQNKVKITGKLPTATEKVTLLTNITFENEKTVYQGLHKFSYILKGSSEETIETRITNQAEKIFFIGCQYFLRNDDQVKYMNDFLNLSKENANLLLEHFQTSIEEPICNNLWY